MLSLRQQRDSVAFEIFWSETLGRSTKNKIKKNSVSRATISPAMELALTVGGVGVAFSKRRSGQ